MLKSHISRVAGFFHSNPNRWLAAASLAILAALASTLASLGANDAFRPQPKRSQAPATKTSPQANKTYTMYSGLWRTDGGFVSTIRIKNVLVVAPMDVTPVLFMADGTPYLLPSVHLAVSGVATININDALAAAPPSIASHISPYGSAALIHSYSSPGHVSASIALIDASRSLSYTFPFAEPMGDPMEQTLEGLWWKHDPGVSGWIALSNVSDAGKQVNVQLAGPGNDSQPARTVDLAPHTTQMLRFEDFASNPSPLAKPAGGIRMQYTGQPGSVLVTGGLENDAEGYSANIPFWGHDMSSVPTTSITYASAGLMIGKPDPMMMPGFPNDTTFSPYLVLRNTTEKPLDVSLQLNYMREMGGAAPVTRNLPAQHLAPFEARQVDMQAALNSAGLAGNCHSKRSEESVSCFNGSINLSTTFTGKRGELLLASGSVDQTGTYVFEVQPQGVGISRSKYANYWGVANGNDTMFSLWNPTNAAQDILATFYYSDGSGKYTLPVHLERQASTMIDMAMLIGEHQPDASGNVIPSNIQEGSADFASAKGRHESITLVIAAGVFNVSTATCDYDCIDCCGYNQFQVICADPIIVVGENTPCDVQGTDCTGQPVNLDYDVSSWGSSDISVATADSVSGDVTGKSPGQATIRASLEVLPDYQGLWCGYIPVFCPEGQHNPSTIVTVLPRIDSISPSRGLIGATTSSVTINGQGFSGGHVNTPAAIQVSNITTATDTQITFDAVISSTATPGNNAGAISVTASNETSNAKDFYVQVPASLSIVPGTAAGTTEQMCSSNACGTIVTFKYQVNDQDSPAQPIHASMSMWDSFGSFSPDNLQMQGKPFVTTCSPNQTNSGPCGVSTFTDGTFAEGGVGACSTLCYNGACTTGGPSGVPQTWHIASQSITQQISEYCEKVLVNGTQVQ